MEVKQPGAQLTPAEQEMLPWWPGDIPVVHSGEEALAAYLDILAHPGHNWRAQMARYDELYKLLAAHDATRFDNFGECSRIESVD